MEIFLGSINEAIGAKKVSFNQAAPLDLHLDPPSSLFESVQRDPFYEHNEGLGFILKTPQAYNMSNGDENSDGTVNGEDFNRTTDNIEDLEHLNADWRVLDGLEDLHVKSGSDGDLSNIGLSELDLEKEVNEFSIPEVLIPDDDFGIEFHKSIASDSTKQTPQTNRTIEEIFSPGSFFASRSGHLGALEHDQFHPTNSSDRPTWYTPRVDGKGRTIDLIGDSTPMERKEKGERYVRKPLYEQTPRKGMHDSDIDPFDWERELANKVLDTIIDEETSSKGSSRRGHQEVQNTNNQTRKPQIQNIKLPSSPKSPLDSSKRHTLEFAELALHTSKQVSVRICNTHSQKVVFNLLCTGLFFIPISELIIDKESYVDIPVWFRPGAIGKYEEILCIRWAEGSVRVRLKGECI